MTQYNSILLRQNLQDNGLMPRTGGYTACPDIIPAGVTPVKDPTAVYTSDASYATDPGQPVVEKASNYIYIRGKNLSTSPVTGEARVFYAPQSLFLYPSQWLNNGLKTSQGADTSEIKNLAASAIGVTTDPFAFIPEDTGEHHCLVGFISTPAYPFEQQKPPNAVTSQGVLAKWIAENGGTGWHNVQFTAADSPTFTNHTTYPASSTPQKVHVTITCTGCAVGTQVSFSCGTPLPDGSYISLPKTKVETTGTVGYFIPANVPAGWTSSVTYSYWAGGAPLANWNVSMSVSVVTDNDPALESLGRLASDVFPEHKMYSLDSKAFADMPVNHIIPCGSDSTMAPPTTEMDC